MRDSPKITPANPPAFPRPVSEFHVGESHDEYHPQQEGMTLRDYFAAAAVTGQVMLPDIDKVARWAYDLADAMLKERAKQ